VSLDDFVVTTRQRGPGWESVAEDADIQRRPAVFPDGIGWPGAVLVAQALHHADDHRTQICSILAWTSGPTPGRWVCSCSDGVLQDRTL
jgi:hypothetical protein